MFPQDVNLRYGEINEKKIRTPPNQLQSLCLVSFKVGGNKAPCDNNLKIAPPQHTQSKVLKTH
jgi:hypothetical protein